MASIVDIGNGGSKTDSLIHLDIKSISRELAKIPTWLKSLLAIVIVFGIIYFKVFHVKDTREMDRLTKELNALTYKVSASVLVVDYTKDYERIVNEFQVLYALNKTMNEMHIDQTNIILEFISQSPSIPNKDLYIKRLQENQKFYKRIQEIYLKESKNIEKSIVVERLEKLDSLRSN